MVLGPPTRSPWRFGCAFRPAVQQNMRSHGASTHVLPYRNRLTGVDPGRNPPTWSAWEHLWPGKSDAPEPLHVYLCIVRSCVEITMTKYGAHLLESGALS